MQVNIVIKAMVFIFLLLAIYVITCSQRQASNYALLSLNMSSNVVPNGVQISNHTTMLPIYGPKEFKRAAGPPQEFLETFQNCETDAQYKLVVQNGNAANAYRVSSAFISLNGVEVIGPTEFSQNVERIERPVTVKHENQIRLHLSSIPDSRLTLSIECVSNCLDVRISSPVHQSTVNQSMVTIKGTLITSAEDAGVVVNKHVADTQGGRFAVVQVPLASGTNIITAAATNPCLNRAETAVSVNRLNEEGNSVRIVANPKRGTAPLTVDLQADPVLTQSLAAVEWDFNGDGVNDVSGPTLLEASYTYPQPGLFIPKVTITDVKGNQFSGEYAINTLSETQIVNQLQKKWAGMLSALARRDIERAVQFIAEADRARYKVAFHAIQERLPGIARELDGSLHFEELAGGVAILTRRTLVDGTEREVLIEFIRDHDGIWRIRFF